MKVIDHIKNSKGKTQFTFEILPPREFITSFINDGNEIIDPSDSITSNNITFLNLFKIMKPK